MSRTLSRLLRRHSGCFGSILLALGLLATAPAQVRAYGQVLPVYDNPPGRPLPSCTCKNLEELQDQLESAEFARRAFEEAANKSTAGPGELQQKEINAVGQDDRPVSRISVVGAETDTSTSACTIHDADNRRTAPCQEIYEAYRAHEMHHQMICEHYWRTQGGRPEQFQTGKEYFLEEAVGYAIAAKVYRATLEKILENSTIKLQFHLDQSLDPSRFDADLEMKLDTAPGASPNDGQVEWFGKGTMAFSDIVHLDCPARALDREDILVARTENFRVLSFHHEPGAAIATYRCKPSFTAPMPALLAEQWKQYLLRESRLDLAAFGDVRGIAAALNGIEQKGLTPAAAALLRNALAMVDQQTAPRTSYPWSPLVGVKVGDSMVVQRLGLGPSSVTDKAKLGGRPEVYLDDFSPLPMVKVESRIQLDCH